MDETLDLPSGPGALSFPSYRLRVLPVMVTKRLPLLSVRVRGGWQGWKIFQVRRGRQYVREFTDYDKSPKAHLSPFQAAMRDAVASWKLLDAETKLILDRRAIYMKKHYSGYCLYISEFLKARFNP